MKIRIRKSALKARKLHGFRAKPKSHKPKGSKLKNIRKYRRILKRNRERYGGTKS